MKPMSSEEKKVHMAILAYDCLDAEFYAVNSVFIRLTSQGVDIAPSKDFNKWCLSSTIEEIPIHNFHNPDTFLRLVRMYDE